METFSIPSHCLVKTIFVKLLFHGYDLSDDLDKWERLTIADALEEITFENEEQVFMKGDIGKDFFLILEG